MSIFVGNLPFRAEQEDVIQLFAPFGEVANCSLPLERDTGRKRGFAFIEMADEAAEAAAIEGLQNAELMGRPLRINKAEPRGGGGPRRGGGGYGGGDQDSAQRASGAKGWEDRSYGSSESPDRDENRSRRRRGGSSDSVSSDAEYGGAEG